MERSCQEQKNTGRNRVPSPATGMMHFFNIKNERLKAKQILNSKNLKFSICDYKQHNGKNITVVERIFFLAKIFFVKT